MAGPNYERPRDAADSQAREGAPSRRLPDDPRHEMSSGGTSQSDPIGRLVDIVARINASVGVKLLGGFLVVVLLLLAMAILSFIVVARMDRQVQALTPLQERLDHAREMIYLVTAQSHFRAMALLTDEDSWNVKIDTAKQAFSVHLAAVERTSTSGEEEFFDQVSAANTRFTESSAEALAFYNVGDIDQALEVHLEEEHPISHELEGAMGELIESSFAQWADAVGGFESDRRLLTAVLWGFSGVSITVALLLGTVLSLSFSRPVRKIDTVLARVATGDFTPRADVPNRDEIGTLGKNLNNMVGQLSIVYDELKAVNNNLEKTVADQVQQLERSTALKRYLSPQLADSILGGGTDVDLTSRRQDLTILFSDIRGFTAMSERMEPEELVELLNKYLTGMTDIVFEHGGTLDKYIGDAIMVFFGNPVPYNDHALRAVRTAIEMKQLLGPLQEEWFNRTEETLSIGIGITTGYVTVGNIGSPARADYTVIGNRVNLASRLADRAEAGQILIADRTLVAVREFVNATEVDEIELKGVARPIRIYSIEDASVTPAPRASP